MANIKSLIGVAGVLVIGWSTASLAGGHAGAASVVRPLAHPGARMQAFGGLGGRGGWLRAHHRLALSAGRGWPHLGGFYRTPYGHVGTAQFGHAGRLPRFGADGLGYGRRRLAAYAFGYGPGVGYGAGSGFGYAEPSLAATFAEPPLGPSPYSGEGGLSFEEDGGYGPALGYGEGPRIISVRGEDGPPGTRDCSCGGGSGRVPVVYRFGVGSYY